jgi:hypothetical protein
MERQLSVYLLWLIHMADTLVTQPRQWLKLTGLPGANPHRFHSRLTEGARCVDSAFRNRGLCAG